MHLKLIIIGLLLSPIANSISIDTCQPRVFQRGIGVGNNNYKGQDCVDQVQKKDDVIIHQGSSYGRKGITSRTIASENEVQVYDVIETEKVHINVPVEVGTEAQYDYGSEE